MGPGNVISTDMFQKAFAHKVSEDAICWMYMKDKFAIVVHKNYHKISVARYIRLNYFYKVLGKPLFEKLA